MDRLIAFDRQVLVFGVYAKEREDKKPNPLCKEPRVTNLGPGGVYVRALTVEDVQGLMEARCDIWLEPGAEKTFFDMKMLDALEDRLSGGENPSVRFRNAVRVDNAYKMGCRAISHHGDHHLQWKVEMRSEMKEFRAESAL